MRIGRLIHLPGSGPFWTSSLFPLTLLNGPKYLNNLSYLCPLIGWSRLCVSSPSFALGFCTRLRNPLLDLTWGLIWLACLWLSEGSCVQRRGFPCRSCQANSNHDWITSPGHKSLWKVLLFREIVMKWFYNKTGSSQLPLKYSYTGLHYIVREAVISEQHPLILTWKYDLSISMRVRVHMRVDGKMLHLPKMWNHFIEVNFH